MGVALVARDAAKCNGLTEPLMRAAYAIFKNNRRVVTRSELRNKLAKLRDAAEIVGKIVLDPDILAIDPHLHEAFGAPEGLDVPGAMDRLTRLVDRHLRELDAAKGQKGPTTTAALYGYQNPRLLCAAVIAEAWRRCRGNPPAHTTMRAQDACAAAGRASSRVQSGDTREGAAWEGHLRRVRSLDPEGPEDSFLIETVSDLFTTRDANA